MARIFIFRGWNVKRTKVFTDGISYRYEIGYSNRPDTKVILEYTYGRSIPVSVRVHKSVLHDERISKNLEKILNRKVHLPDPIDDQDWYELQSKNKQKQEQHA